jgi:hypothetical protein
MKKIIPSQNTPIENLDADLLAEIVGGAEHCTAGSSAQQLGCEIGYHVTEAAEWAYEKVADLFR